MKTSQILIPLFVIAISIALYQFFRIRETNSVGKSLVTKTQPFSVHRSDATQKILVLGDSLAVGVGSSNPTHSIAGRIAQDFPNTDITNAAVSGARVQDLDNQLRPLKDTHFDLILIQIGANDVTHFTSAKSVQANLREILTQTKKICPHTIVWSSGSVGFAPVFIPPLSWIYTLKTKLMYRDIEKTVLASGETYIPLYLSWSKDVFRTDISRYYAADKFHIADAAYAMWYAKIKPAIAEILKTDTAS